VFCGSAFKNKGVQRLLDAIIAYLPSPHDLKPILGHHPRTNEIIERKSSEEAPFSALAFKVMTDPYVGKLTFMRIYSGVAKAGSYLFNPVSQKKERLGRILQMHANSRLDLKTVMAGDIVAAVGLKHTRTGDTLCDDNKHIVLESMHFPEPVIAVATNYYKWNG
jgi:elongation factor G